MNAGRILENKFNSLTKSPLHPRNKSVFLNPDEDYECDMAVNTIFTNKCKTIAEFFRPEVSSSRNLISLQQ